MKRSLLALVVLGTLVASPAWSNARTYFGFTIGISNAPPAPVFFRERPHVVFVPEERVYVVDDDDYDCDAFFTGDYWYVVDDGYWYRAHSYRGPYQVVDVRYVPRGFWSCPRSTGSTVAIRSGVLLLVISLPFREPPERIAGARGQPALDPPAGAGFPGSSNVAISASSRARSSFQASRTFAPLARQ